MKEKKNLFPLLFSQFKFINITFHSDPIFQIYAYNGTKNNKFNMTWFKITLTISTFRARFNTMFSTNTLHVQTWMDWAWPVIDPWNHKKISNNPKGYMIMNAILTFWEWVIKCQIVIFIMIGNVKLPWLPKP